jgi:predicted unusual protein kinase regulating ubiquinone biosynthesis (AarF/ABC1/UbiB family)
MADEHLRDKGVAVPGGRLARLGHLGGIAGGIAGGMAVTGLRSLAQGRRPDMAALLMTPANARRVADGLSRMRGAALKLGQMLSMDSGAVLPPEVAQILARLRSDASPMPPAQVQAVLVAQWGDGWRSGFARFDARPFAAASIGQVHRATTRDGRDLAIKVQYPGVRASIDSDVDNIATLLRLPGLMPRDMVVAPLLAEAKRQLHAEADYAAEARHLAHFGRLMAGSDIFAVPEFHADLSTPQILAMTFLESRPLDALEDAPQDLRDRVAARLIDLVLRELFEFGAMQTDPNLANYRYDPGADRIVLLDFGAVQAVPPPLAANFRALLHAALDGDGAVRRAAMLRIGYFDGATAERHQDLIEGMFAVATAPLRAEGLFDFGRSDVLERLRDMGLAIGRERELSHVPPAATLFLHRKIAGMYLMATRLRARVALRPMLERYRCPPPPPPPRLTAPPPGPKGWR